MKLRHLILPFLLLGLVVVPFAFAQQWRYLPNLRVGNIEFRTPSGAGTIDLDCTVVVYDDGDTTAGIQDAVDSLAGDGTVCIPAGTYSISGTVGVTNSDVHFRGAGRGATILQFAASATSRMFNVSTSGLSNISFRDIEFDGNGANATSALDILRFNDTNNVLVENCYFHDNNDAMAWHDYTTTAPENITYINNEFTNWGDDGGTAQAILIEQASFIHILGNYFHDAADAGATGATIGTAIQIGGTGTGLQPVSYITVAGNIIDTVGTNGTGSARGIGVIGTTGTKSSHVSITGNVVRFTEGDSISVANVDYFSITGNTVIDSDESSIGVWSSSYGTVSGNSVYNGEAGIGVHEGSAGGSVTNVSVTGNTVINTDAADALTNGAINVGNAQNFAVNNIVVSGNEIRFDTTSMGEYGIRVNGHASNKVTDVIVSNNSVENAGTDGIYVTQGTNVSVLGNHSLTNAAMGINVDNTTGTLIEGNVTTGNSTQGINDGGTNTTLKIGFNITGTTENTAMSGTATLTAGTVTVPASSTNPYIRASNGCKIAVGLVASGAAAPYISTLSDGSMVITGNGTDSVWWKIIECDETA